MPVPLVLKIGLKALSRTSFATPAPPCRERHCHLLAGRWFVRTPEVSCPTASGPCSCRKVVDALAFWDLGAVVRWLWPTPASFLLRAIPSLRCGADAPAVVRQDRHPNRHCRWPLPAMARSRRAAGLARSSWQCGKPPPGAYEGAAPGAQAEATGKKVPAEPPLWRGNPNRNCAFGQRDTIFHG
jgi:hypothetical protein